jgi:hypothetical protein
MSKLNSILELVTPILCLATTFMAMVFIMYMHMHDGLVFY